MNAAVVLRLQGDPALRVGAGPWQVLEPRAAALLALAALEPGIARERAARWLWPDSADPRRNLRQQLLRFRRAHGHELLAGDGTLRLADGVALEAADAPLLGMSGYDDCDAFAAWLAQRRAAESGHRLQAARDALARAEAQGDAEGMLAAALRLVALDPDAEAHHEALVRAHYLRGDAAAGLAAFERWAQQLQARFGLAPAAGLQQLAGALRSAAALPVPRMAPVPATLLRPPRLIGRERERRAVLEAWAGGQAALLLGEAGLGKSRLLAELAGGAHALAVAARPGDAGVPYATLARLLRQGLGDAPAALAAGTRRELARVLPELAPALPLPADGQRLLLQQAIEQALAGLPAPLLAVDDLHFADAASLEMLTALVGAPALQGRRWLFARRPAEGGAAAEALHDTLLEAQALVPVTLAPLDEAQMAELVDSLGLPGLEGAALAAGLVRHTGGNPLFALETLRQPRAPGSTRLPQPASVGALIERRLRQLSPPALALARLAAVAGVDFDIALAEAVLRAGALELADRWAELEAAQVLRGEAFAHDLVFEATLRTLPGAVAARLHGEVAAWLEQRAAEPARVAAHWLQAGEAMRAVPHLVAAAERAYGRFRHAEAAGHHEQAAEALRAAGEPDEAFEQMYRAAEATARITDLPAAHRAAERLAAFAHTSAQHARAVYAQARVAELEADYARMEHLGDAVVRLAGEADDRELQAEGLQIVSVARYWGDRIGEAVAPMARARALWLAAGRPTRAGESGNDLAVLLEAQGRAADAAALLDASVNELEAHQRWRDVAVNLMHRAHQHGVQGRADAALVLLRRALQLLDEAERTGTTGAWCVAALAQALRQAGRYGEALPLLDDWMQRHGRAVNPLAGRVVLERGWAWLELGRPHLALQALQQAEAWPHAPVHVQERALALRLALHAAGHAPGPGAVPDLDTMQDPRRRSPLLREWLAAQPAAARAALLGAALDFEAARPACRLALQVLAVETALDLGRDASALARELCAGLQETGPMLYPPRAWLAVCRALAGVDAAAAQQARARGVAWIEAALAAGLPDEFVESFRWRNPVNRALLSPSGSGAAGP